MLESVGFEEVDLTDAVAAAEGVHAPELASAASERDRERSLDVERAPAELASAEQQVGDVAAELASLDGRIARVARRRERLDVELAELRAQLQGVERRIRAALEERRTRERECDRKRRASAGAERVAEPARERLDRLS